MRRKSPDLTISQPRCRSCHSLWRPPLGVIADKAYCARCSFERRAVAAERFGLRPIVAADLIGPYMLPKRSRPS